ncbi:MAG: PEP/pyruvate-binding domain-containing protein [Chloroflexota bacterium]
MTFVCFFDQITPDSLPLVGGKAHNLARLAQAGFAVPHGFCLTTEAYRRHLAAHGLADPIRATLARTDLSDEQKADHIRRLIVSVDLPLDVHCAVLGAYHKLTGSKPGTPLAIRSSALAEDTADASFAGQHDTILDVRDESALMESIKRCWASLWTARASSYRSRMRSGDPDIALAVIVQHMLTADCAGVAFTVNPVSGADEIVIEAVAGLGEALVSGQVTPDRYRLDRHSLKPLETAATRVGQPVLDADQLEQVARLAAGAQDHFGCPQDIEWACSHGRIYLLQSRPVTTLAQPDFVTADGQLDMAALLRRAQARGTEIWTDDNVGEVIPDAVTPLTWSVLEPLGNDAFRSFLRRVGVRRYPAAGLFGHFFGRVYFNQSQFQRLMRRFFPSHLSQNGSDRTGLVERGLAALAVAETGLRSLLLIPVLPRQAERLVAAIPGELRRAPLPQTLPDEALRDEIEQWQAIGKRVMATHLAVTVFAALLYSLLDKLVGRWGEGQIETAHLMAGLSGMASAEMGRDLAALADEIAGDETLVASLLATSPQALSGWASSLPADHRFTRALARFLDRHGHASLREFELAYPHWREEPGYVLSLVQSHLRARQNSPADPRPEAQERREQASQIMHRRLSLTPRGLFFRILLHWAQRYSVIRENVKYAFVAAHGHLRTLYLALASRLVERGALAQTSDLFYLSTQQMWAALEPSADPAATARLAIQQREQYQQTAQTARPRIIEQRRDGSLHPLSLPGNGQRPGRPTDEGIELHGVAASAGRTTGRARVVRHLQESTHLKPGEILVTHSTNPAWAPLLLNAGALITEVGGLLSHGAIVAREYGLPAVLNVRGATQTIRTGQLIEVDAYSGTVRLLNGT